MTYNTLQYKTRNSLIKPTYNYLITLRNRTLITFYEHVEVNLKTVLVENCKDKILGFGLVFLFKLAG